MKSIIHRDWRRKVTAERAAVNEGNRWSGCVREVGGTYKKGSCLCVIRAVSKVKSQ